SPGRRSVRRALSELGRVLSLSRRRILFFHRVNDPYSVLLLQFMSRLMRDFNIQLEIRLVLDVPSEAFPEPEKYARYAFQDAIRLAQFHQLNFPASARTPNLQDSLVANRILLAQKGNWMLSLFQEVTDALWGIGTTTLTSCANRYGMVDEQDAQKMLANGRHELVSKGHYASATLYYGGEWYWGVDRVLHLVERLSRQRLQTHPVLQYDYGKAYRLRVEMFDQFASLKMRPKQPQTLEFYFSFRSPYSYLALERVVRLAEAYKVPLHLRPVRPMVQRGVPLLAAKKKYILSDAKREAEHYGIPFGKISDPLDAIDRVLAAFAEAQGSQHELQYSLNALRAIWSQGKFIGSDRVMKQICDASGVDWEHAKILLTSQTWQKSIENNEKDLAQLGLWGVPVMRYGDCVVWGQDRIWTIENVIVDSKN
ncbi:MAG TPA: DsbA family protein, partial [Pseudomonadales bacterium]|nr:DsbA family protein [Pseudomonadales bacterium]